MLVIKKQQHNRHKNLWNFMFLCPLVILYSLKKKRSMQFCQPIHLSAILQIIKWLGPFQVPFGFLPNSLQFNSDAGHKDLEQAGKMATASRNRMWTAVGLPWDSQRPRSRDLLWMWKHTHSLLRDLLNMNSTLLLLTANIGAKIAILPVMLLSGRSLLTSCVFRLYGSVSDGI